MMVTNEEIQGSAMLTQEMRALLKELNTLISYSRQSGKPVSRITLNRKQWEPIRKDRKRHGWKQPRSCGLIHYQNEEPTFDGVRLGAPSAQELQKYIQEDAFK